MRQGLALDNPVSHVAAETRPAPARGGARAIPVRGEAKLVLGGNGPASRILHLHQKDPVRMLFPLRPRGDLRSSVLVTTSGGLVAGDELDVEIVVEGGAAGLITPQAAEKIYRSDGADCRIDIRLSVGADGWLEWLPQETIMFQGARLRRRTRIEFDRRARLLAGEITVFGRRAMGEIFSRGYLSDEWDVRRGGRPVWADRFLLDGPVRAIIDHPAGLGGAEAMATAVYAGPDAAKQLATARRIIGETGNGTRCGATVVSGMLLVRWLGDAYPLRKAFGAFWAAFRHAAGGLPPALPRLWHV